MLKEKLALAGIPFEVVAANYFMYVFGAINQAQAVRNIGGNKKAVRSLLRDVKYDGYLLLNCKLYAWAWYRHKHADAERPRYAHYGVPFEDAKFLRRLNLEHLNLSYPSCGVEEMRDRVRDELTRPSARTHMGKLVSAKLRFLIKSYGVTRQELYSDLGGEAAHALYFQYPRFHSDLHFTNVVKTTIQNYAMSTIKYHTCEARQRLVKDTQGQFHSLIEDIDSAAVFTAEAPDPYMHHIKDQLTTLVELSPQMSSKVQSFLLSLAGHHDSGLSAFLKKDNSEAADRWDYARYTGLCAQYYGLSEARVERIFARLRDNLR